MNLPPTHVPGESILDAIQRRLRADTAICQSDGAWLMSEVRRLTKELDIAKTCLKGTVMALSSCLDTDGPTVDASSHCEAATKAVDGYRFADPLDAPARSSLDVGAGAMTSDQAAALADQVHNPRRGEILNALKDLTEAIETWLEDETTSTVPIWEATGAARDLLDRIGSKKERT